MTREELDRAAAAFRSKVAAAREAQGLPPTIEDPTTLDRIVALLADGDA